MNDMSVPELSPQSVADGRAAADEMIDATKPVQAGHGARNPLAASKASGVAWEIAPSLWAWMDRETGDVYLQGDDGDVTVPATLLPLLARSLLAAHVANGRNDLSSTR